MNSFVKAAQCFWDSSKTPWNCTPMVFNHNLQWWMHHPWLQSWNAFFSKSKFRIKFCNAQKILKYILGIEHWMKILLFKNLTNLEQQIPGKLTM